MNQCHFGPDGHRHFTTSFCENSVVVKLSPRHVGELFFLEKRKGLKVSSLKTTASSLLLTKYKIKLLRIYIFLVLR